MSFDYREYEQLTALAEDYPQLATLITEHKAERENGHYYVFPTIADFTIYLIETYDLDEETSDTKYLVGGLPNPMHYISTNVYARELANNIDNHNYILDSDNEIVCAIAGY